MWGENSPHTEGKKKVEYEDLGLSSQGQPEAAGILQEMQMLTKSRDWKLQPRFSHIPAAESIMHSCLAVNWHICRLILKYTWFYPKIGKVPIMAKLFPHSSPKNVYVEALTLCTLEFDCIWDRALKKLILRDWSIIWVLKRRPWWMGDGDCWEIGGYFSQPGNNILWFLSPKTLFFLMQGVAFHLLSLIRITCELDFFIYTGMLHWA